MTRELDFGTLSGSPTAMLSPAADRSSGARKILVLGSGPIRIGQAAEFDYSGSQACRALKEEGCTVILLNSNPATIQTDPDVADVVYLKPLLPDVVEEILQVHRPDGVVATLGGQTALNLCVTCAERGIWERYGTRVLGTPVETVARAEGREAFRQTMLDIGEPVVASVCVADVAAARVFAATTPFPLIVRPDFTLGGTGSGVARSAAELDACVEAGLRASPVRRVLVERYLEGWREIEAEVVRDASGNALCVCSMENVDPMGVHTGDSVVVSPVLTLTDCQWQRLRSASLRIVEALDVRGACNVQLAVSPDGDDYAVIEVNPRASRSSALASKATGYPIARIAAKIALGRTLTEMPNPVTGVGSALSEPALDYVAVKLPRWPFDAFPQADPVLGTRMKATGEVLALGLSFPQALLKAYRSTGTEPLFDPRLAELREEELWRAVLAPTHRRIEAIFTLLRRGVSAEEIARRSWIAPWFVSEMARIVAAEERLRGEGLSVEALRAAKVLGFSDKAVAAVVGRTAAEVEAAREVLGLAPGFREVDGCAGEVPAGSGYFYGVWGAAGEECPAAGAPAVAVLGSGPIRIAQGVEFDYCCVKAVEALRRRGVRSIMVNNNPETVSTDFDISDALYVEPLAEEDVLAVLRRENVFGIFSGFGGQTSLGLGQQLAARGVRLLGTGQDAVDAAEDRGRFSALVARLDISQPEGGAARNVEDAVEQARKLGYPLMVRPSFVLGGVAMRVVTGEEELLEVLEEAFAVGEGQNVLLDRFLPGKEFEVDALCDGEDVLVPGVFEHLDPAGIHSGDSLAIFPDLSLTERHRREILDVVRKLGGALGVRGLLNVQFVLHDGALTVIEANPRASRTVPIVCKLTGIPLVDLAVRIALGERLADMVPQSGLFAYKGPYGVKVPVFSTEKLPGVDARLGPRMQSTGEALGVADTVAEALWEGLRGAGISLDAPGRALLSVRDDRKGDVCALATTLLAQGWTVEATPGTAAHLARWGLPVETVPKGEALLAEIRRKRWQLLVNVPGLRVGMVKDGMAIRRAAIEEGLPCFHSLETASAVLLALQCYAKASWGGGK